jgi:phage portal protein BeeE
MLPAGVEVRFDIDELIRPEMAIRYAGHQSALSNGWMSVNEVRQAEGLPPIDGGSVYRHPLNIGTDAVPTDPTQPDTSAPGGQS